MQFRVELPMAIRQVEDNVLYETINFRNVFGTSSFWKLIPIPAAVGGLTLYFATERVEGFFCHATSMVVCISPVVKIGQESFLLCIVFN